MAKYKDLLTKHYSLSPSLLSNTTFKNTNSYSLASLLDDVLEKKYNGVEIGSNAYMNTDSGYYFLKTKALQNNYYTEVLSSESAVPMNRKSFIDYKLCKGDILLSKDSNIGECAILSKDMPKYMIGGALYKLPIKSEDRLYVFSFLKSKHFKKQLDEVVPKGATIRHAGKKFLDCLIVFPNYEKSLNEVVVKIVKLLTQSIINKETILKQKDELIFQKIKNELLNNSLHVESDDTCKISDIISFNRLDAGFYSKKAKDQKAILDGYINGSSSLEELGYDLKRGQNLQVTCIGKSLYSEEKRENYYTVIKPTNFNDFGTVEHFEYLGNNNKLQTLMDGDIVFSAEGTVGKCVLFTKTDEKWITNIHGMILKSDDSNRELSAFVSCILRFYKRWGYYEHFSVGGQGGSLGKNYWESIKIPNFSPALKEEISKLYHNEEKICDFNLDDYLKKDDNYSQNAGVIEISRNIYEQKKVLDYIFDMIVNNRTLVVDELMDQIRKTY